MYVEGPLTTVSMEGRLLWAQWGGQPFGPHLPKPVSINHSQHTINTQTMRHDWFYSRQVEVAKTTMWVDLAPTWAIHYSTRGSRPVLTKLSVLDFCDRTGTGIFLVRPLRPVCSGRESNPRSPSRERVTMQTRPLLAGLISLPVSVMNAALSSDAMVARIEFWLRHDL